MDVTSFDRAGAFLEGAKPFLARRELEHTMFLGICERAVTSPELFPGAFFVALHDHDAIVGAALRTPPHNLVLSQIEGDPIAALTTLVRTLHAQRIDLPGVYGPVSTASEFARLWCEATGATSSVQMAQRTLAIERVVHPPACGVFTPATASDVDLITTWMLEFVIETGLPESDRKLAAKENVAARIASGAVYVVRDADATVSMAVVSGTPRVRSIGAVYTPPHLRGRGYASSCVAQLTQSLLDGGAWRVTLNTDAKNPTSNKIYEALGYRCFGEASLISFHR